MDKNKRNTGNEVDYTVNGQGEAGMLEYIHR